MTPTAIPTNTKIASKRFVACENIRMTVIMVPGPAVRGKVNGMIEKSSWSVDEMPFFSESMFNATVISRIPPAIWKAYSSRLNI